MISTGYGCRSASRPPARCGLCCSRAVWLPLMLQVCRPWQRFTRLRLAGRAGIARSLADA